MAELSNGSIFCACIKDKFVDSLIELSGKDLEYLFIEASGLADPANFQQILAGIAKNTVNHYQFEGSICVVDGEHFVELSDILPALPHQVVYANAVIVNKADLIDQEQIEEVLNKIHEINQDVATFVTSYCRVDIKEVISQFLLTLPPGTETTNTYETRPNSFILKSEEVIPYEGLQGFLEALGQDSYRMKGFVHTDKGYFEVSAVFGHIQITPWPGEDMGTELVIISAVGIKMLSEIVKASNDHVGGRLKL